MLITFSGLDGAGKTTLIRELEAVLVAHGYRVTVLTMYDHISFYSYMRRIRDGVKARLNYVGPPQQSSVLSPAADPRIDVSDKTGRFARTVYLLVRSRTARKLVIVFDIASLWVRRLVVEKCRRAILITDRYVYDTLADVADRRCDRWPAFRFFLRLIPCPDVPVFVDVPAEIAYQRKQEYPVEYMAWRRMVYQTIFGQVPSSLTIANDDLIRSSQILGQAVLDRLKDKWRLQ